MPLIENDAEVNPTISQPQLEYIRSLTDTHKQYTRFFDALLIPKPSHPAFFRDLKAFRLLPITIDTLSHCNPDHPLVSKEQRLQYYKDVTTQFLSSRFAHPWCRKAMAGTGNSKVGGWWGAEWSATGRKMSNESKLQQEKLHTMLVPLWVCFRKRMFPGDAAIDEWWEKQQRHEKTTMQTTNLAVPEALARSKSASDASLSESSELRMATHLSGHLKGYDSDEEDVDVGANPKGQQSESVATGILRLAAAGMLFNSMSKMQKWKLKRELKKR